MTTRTERLRKLFERSELVREHINRSATGAITEPDIPMELVDYLIATNDLGPIRKDETEAEAHRRAGRADLIDELRWKAQQQYEGRLIMSGDEIED